MSAGAKPIRKELKPGAVPSVFWWKADRQDQGRDVRKKRRLAKKELEEEVERRMQRDPAEEQVGTGDDYLLQYTETSKQNLAFTSSMIGRWESMIV